MNAKKLKVGISEIAASIPRWFIEVGKIAEKRQLPIEYANNGLELIQARIPYKTCLEDLIIEALKKINYQDIDRFFIATESDYDFSKPKISIETLNKRLKSTIVPFQIKFACLSGVQAMILACEYAAAHDKPAIVIIADRSLYKDAKAEITQGAGAIALKIERNPKILELDFKKFGQYSKDINDFQVPVTTAPFPMVNGPLTKPAFIQCVIKAVNDYKQKNQEFGSIIKNTDKIIMHTPFSKMVVWTSAVLWRYENYDEDLFSLIKKCTKNPQTFPKFKKLINEVREIAEFQNFFQEKIKPGLRYNPYVGNCYNASIFISLISALENTQANQNICIAGYGAGSGSLVLMGKTIKSNFKTDLIDQIKSGEELTSEQYQDWRTDTVKKIRGSLI
jgi:hydroxymethylglutaryl-CoA synthase